jgi:hypothetical protein
LASITAENYGSRLLYHGLPEGAEMACTAMTTFSFFITWNSILSFLPVNKKYAILNYNPPPRLHSR